MIRILKDVERWECVYEQCGAKCCGEGVQLTLRDLKQICSLGLKWDEFAWYDEDARIFRMKGIDGKCVFVDSDSKCRIREKEPLVCRLLPFKIVDVSYSDEPIMKLKAVVDCPGEGRGRRLNAEMREQIEKDALSFLHENQQLIKRIKKEGVEGVLRELES
jgi:Fe-S-cluster containining protein